MNPIRPEATQIQNNHDRSGPVHPDGPWRPTLSPETLVMDRLVDLLVEKAKAGIHWPELYEHATNLLRALGMPTRQALLAIHRLRNAQQYAEEREFGLATFELRLVRTQLT